MNQSATSTWVTQSSRLNTPPYNYHPILLYHPSSKVVYLETTFGPILLFNQVYPTLSSIFKSMSKSTTILF